jgi:hypothetical protein
MNVWKWSTGEQYYKSARKEKEYNEKQLEPNYDYNYNYDYDSQTNAINLSLSESDSINITNKMFSRNQNISATRREDLDTKIADRELLAQRGVNPFLQTSYVNDVVTRDIYLKPVNTTFDRIKPSSKDD